MWTRLSTALVLLASGCGPRLQVALWQDAQDRHYATIRCTAAGQAAEAELASTATLTAETPHPEVK